MDKKKSRWRYLTSVGLFVVDHPGALFQAAVFIGFVIATPFLLQRYNEIQSYDAAFVTRHPSGSCSLILICDADVPVNGTVLSSHDYTVECDSWYGGHATCPREDLNVHVFRPAMNVTGTINCQFYKAGDNITVNEHFHFDVKRIGYTEFPGGNETISWQVRGSC